MAKFGLEQGRQPQKYGLGLKELWEVRPEMHRPGLVQHTLGWPLDNRTGGGSFLYRYGANLVSVGFVVHLNYRNPHLSPYAEFQRFKTHPPSGTFEGGKRIAYGARDQRGRRQSIPAHLPGGVLVGCAAGFPNVLRIKVRTTPCFRHCRGRSGVRGNCRGPRARRLGLRSTVMDGLIARDLACV